MAEKIAMAIVRAITARCGSAQAPAGENAKCDGLPDAGLVRAGALLHDIGRSRTHGMMHAVAGAEVARELGLPEALVHIIERHIGAGVVREEAARLGLPPKEYLPLTLEEKIVAHADNLAGSRGKLMLKEVLDDLRWKGVPQLVPRMEALHRELSGLCGVDIDEIRV